MTTSIILIVTSFIIILIARNLLSDIRNISNQGIETKGIIFDVEQFAGIDNNINYPIVRFLTREHDWITKSAKIGVIPGVHKKGKEVTVIYQNGNPNNFFIKDRLLYLIPIIILIIGLILMIFGIYFLIHI